MQRASPSAASATLQAAEDTRLGALPGAVRVESVQRKRKVRRGNVSVDELANVSGMSLYIAKEQLEGAEARGVLARDESAIQGVRYYANLFMEE